MRLLILALFTILLSACSNKKQNFSKFINDTKLAAKQKDLGYFDDLYSTDYRRADRYLYPRPNFSPDESILMKAKWFMNQRIFNSEVLRYEDESFKVQGGVFTWSRRAIYSKDADDYNDVEIDFVLQNGEFKLAPHFSHPTQEQLDKLEKMHKRYALYFYTENAANYEIFVNGKSQNLLNKNIHVLNLYDVHKGNNSISFQFEIENTASSISLAASLSYIGQGTQQMFSEKDKVIHLHGKALSGEDVFGKLQISKEFLKDVEDDEISFNVEME